MADVTLQISANTEALEVLCRNLRERAEWMETEARDNDHERNKHVDRFRIRIGGELLSAEECETLRKEAYTLRYFVRQIEG